MPVRFLADADLNEDIVTGLVRREPQIDFQTAQAANLRGLSDPEVLAVAAHENRILVTHDRRTMPRHFADFIQHRYSPGVFVIAQSVRVGIAVIDAGEAKQDTLREQLRARSPALHQKLAAAKRARGVPR